LTKKETDDGNVEGYFCDKCHSLERTKKLLKARAKEKIIPAVPSKKPSRKKYKSRNLILGYKIISQR
jgi:hypothetical protein